MNQPPERAPGYSPPALPGPPDLVTASGVPVRSSGGNSAVRGGILALGLGLLMKGKALLVLVKALPFAKLLLTSGGMIASVAVYAWAGGLAFGVGLVLMILIHELGHGAAMKRAGIAAGWPVFIPFFGAMIAMKGKPESARVEADIAFAGPVAGTGAALAVAALGLLLHDTFFLKLAYIGFFMNLFNLAPFGFLDGGRIARVLSRKAWIFGAIVMGLMFWLSPTPQLLLIGGLGLMHMFQRDNSDLEQVTTRDRLTWGLRYFGLCAFLGAATFFTYELTTRQGF